MESLVIKKEKSDDHFWIYWGTFKHKFHFVTYDILYRLVSFKI
jgi:hypothetical protein